MIKTFVAYTAEIDDNVLAVEEILAGLNLEANLQKNSIGLIACHYEFVTAGTVKAVCDALPFDVAGVIASPVSANGETGPLLLTLMVLTADDAEFVSVLTPSILENPREIITAAYQNAAAGRQDKPKLILTYAPFVAQNSGDDYADTLTAASGGVPCFGTIAIDDNADFSSCFALHNGVHYSDKMAMVLIYGNVSPKFFIAHMSEDKVLDKSSVVTKSAGHIVMEIDGRSVDDYFENLGLSQASETYYALTTLPFLVDYNDGTPKVSKIFIGLTPERFAIFAGAIPEGCNLHVGVAERQDIILTTSNVLDAMLKEAEGASGLLIYSCIARAMTLGGDFLDELSLVNKKWDGRLPVLMAYSGGEFCPTRTDGGEAVNRFHNNTIVACMF